MKSEYTVLFSYSRKAFDRLVMKRSVQRILYYFGKDMEDIRKWVFVTGCYNSGTTLLTNILRQHPMIGGLHTEGAYLTDVLPYPEQFAFPRMWTKCIDELQIDPNTDGNKIAERIKRHWSVWYREKKPILAEKSVSNTVRMPFLNKYFKPAYFIYIVRNGYAVSKGIQQKANLKRWNSPYKNKGYPIEMCAEQWKLSDEVVNKDKHKLENFIKIYYEDLVSDPKSVIDSITDFLKLKPVSDDILTHKYYVHGMVSSIKNMNEKALDRLAGEDWDRIESVAGEVLKKHGYSRDNNKDNTRKNSHSCQG